MAKTNISLITESKNYLTLDETNQIINALQNASYDINAKSYLINDVEIIDSSGKINASALPEISITSVNVVADETAQLALDVQVGDVAIRTDLNKSYVALNSDNVDMSDWQELLADSSVQDLSDLGITATATELNYTTGVTSAIQTQLNNKVDGTVSITVGTTAPSSPSTNDIWIDTN